MKIWAAFFSALVLMTSFFVSSEFAQSDSKVIPPKIIDISKPEFPQAAKDAGVNGQVFIVVLVDKKGKVTVKDVFGPNAPCSNLDDPLVAAVRESAIEATKKATFQPAQLRGKPIDMGFQLTYDFDSKEVKQSLDDGSSSNSTNGEVVNGKLISIPKAKYPDVRGVIAGRVIVRVLIAEDGSVQSVGILSGHPTLRREVLKVVCGAKFQPTLFSGKPVKISGILVYGFSWTYDEK